ncbi:MAG TPA: EAL domain-containing protein [Burkholderiales bacterium]|nr:EAL domain-containing protein [Burkholderiales bacterium]
MQAPSALIREIPYAVQLCLVAIVYFIAAKLSLALAIPPGYATPVWPPSGLALAAALLLGSRIWPGIWIGAALANITVEASFLSAALIASGNTLEALAAGALIRRYVGDPGAFRRGEDVIKFILLCGLSACIAATVAALALAGGHTLDGFRNWWTWWQGDAAGMIIVAPLVLSWCVRDDAAWARQKKLEAACFGLLLALTVYAISSDAASHFAPFSLTFVSLPFILWAGLRFGQREVASAIAVVCAVAVWYTLERRELFASVPLNELLLMLLTFISMVVATGLVLAVVVSERSRVTEELRRKHERAAWQVQKHTQCDSLTGLPNGVLFLERLAQLLQAPGRSGKVVVAVLDIDRFKNINDSHGRRVGDALLTQIAARLSGEPDGGVVARISGACFAVAIPGLEIESRTVAALADEKLARWFGTPYRVGENELGLSVRMGLALFPDHGGGADALFMHAESALQRAKSAGDRYLLYTPTMSERVAAERLSLETQLRQAIERDQFVLHYQPKVDLDTRQVVGFEALIRWRSPELGLVSPLEFIPLLEETGMILEVGSWALRRAVLDQRLWAAEGVRVPRIAVNVSPIQLRQPDFVERVREAVGPASGPCMIDLEITESHIMADIESTIDKLTRIRALGIGIAIDDFGTGYSSLAYLARLPVKTLKIDRAFIVRMLDDEEAMALVQTIISLARSLKLTTVAEGVETEEQADLLELLRCDEVQGYFFSPPKPREQLTELLRTG